MFNYLRRFVFYHNEEIGFALILASVIWLMGVAGADDFNTMHHIYTPIFVLAAKSALGFLVMGLGLYMINVVGGAE